MTHQFGFFLVVIVLMIVWGKIAPLIRKGQKRIPSLRSGTSRRRGRFAGRRISTVLA
jgi:hypothetical protein